jgi:hypothetical protein
MILIDNSKTELKIYFWKIEFNNQKDEVINLSIEVIKPSTEKTI